MFLRRPKPIATVAFNMPERHGPYGGGNQWLKQLAAYLRRSGYRVVHRLGPDVDLVMGTHAGLSGTLGFSYDQVAEVKRANPRLRCIQRINDNDLRKGTAGMDAALAAANRAADHTVFVSSWLREYHSERWFDPSRPHSVIGNGADPAIFHPYGNKSWRPGQTFRLVTHHWSDNPSKGFDTYAKIDQLIAEGVLQNVELWIIGRWPSNMVWRSAETFPACAGRRLADLLRQCHAAVTASKHEPGAMHPVESLQCGLPLLYTEDTGGTVELGRKFGVPLGEDPVSAVRALQEHYDELRGLVLRQAPAGDVMCGAYRQLIQSMLAARE